MDGSVLTFVRAPGDTPNEPAARIKTESREMAMKKRQLLVLPGDFAICRLPHRSPIPPWATTPDAPLFVVTRTPSELSIICPENNVPDDRSDFSCSTGWHCLKIDETFELDEPGVMVSIAAPLAEAGLSVFAEATYETDYFLVNSLDSALSLLRGLGHEIRGL